MAAFFAVAVFCAAFVAFVVSAAAGGGAGLVLLPLLRLIVPINGVPAALSIGTAASSVSRIALFRAEIRWDVVRRFLPAALPATVFGAWLLTRLQPAYVDFCIACFLLSNVRALLMKPAESDARPFASLRYVPLVGAAAGVLSGFTGAVGLAFNGAYLRLGLNRREIVATRAMNEVTLHVVKLVSYGFAGVLTRASILAGCLVAVAALLSSFAVRHLMPRMRDELFHRIGAWAVVLSGAAMFSLSGGEIARLQRAWVHVVSDDGERELQLYWHGRLRLTAEKREHRCPVLERGLRFDQLPTNVRARFRAEAGTPKIVLIEEALGGKERVFEIEYEGADGKHRTATFRQAR